MEEKKMTRKTKLILLFVGVGIAAAFAAVLTFFLIFGAEPTKGNKNITITVTMEDGTEEQYDVQTDAEYLKEAADSVLTLEGEDGDYGFTIYTINGVTADWNDNCYWAIYVDGEYGNYGVDSQPVEDGSTYGFVYETY